MKRHTQKLIHVLGVFAGLSLAIIPLKASAVICSGTDPCTASTGFNAHVAEILTVSLDLPDNWAFGKTGDFLRNGVTLSVASNNGNGFTANMVSKNTTSLVNKDKSTATIPTLAADTTRANFPTNHWGYSLDDTAEGDINSTYKALVEPGGTPINIITSSSAASMTKDIYFGAKADASLASGTYVGTIVFNVVSAVAPPTISRLTYMQDFANLSATDLDSVKTSMVEDKAYELQDTRDNTTYHIAKLKDGKIWLLDNLALDLTDATVQSNLTPETTNATATSLTALKSGNRAAGDNYANAGVSNWTSGASYSAPLVNLTNKDVIPSNAPTGGKGYNKVGGYYNFCAASAGSYCYGNGTSYGTPSGNATEDICPAGWRLPTGNTTGEYAALANAIYGSTGSTSDTTAIANYRNALSLPLSGTFPNGSAYYQGDYGFFWSSTRGGSNYMYSLYADADGVYPVDDGGGRDGGNSVRCLVQ